MQSFQFPSIGVDNVAPIWENGRFHIQNQSSRVLDYLSDNNSFGWNDGLTAFHESEAGDNHIIDLVSRQSALRELRRHVKVPNPVILEIGCSSGFMLQLMQKEFPQAFVIGADIVKEPLISLAEKIPNIPLLRFDLTKCPLADASVDAVVLLNVLEHIEADGQAMEQVKRILKPGGVVVIEVPAGPELYDIYDKLLLHFRRYTAAGLRVLVEKQNLTVKYKSHIGCFLYPAFWAAKKRNRGRFSNVSLEEMQAQVAKNIRTTRSSIIMNMMMRWELFLSKWLSYPFGIRCVMTCVKS